MIRRPYNDEGWILITQMDHAALSGALMVQWGNAAFAAPAPKDEVLLGISEHDNGWEEWDKRPEIHLQTRTPLHFNELANQAYSEIWRRGAERYRKSHPYACLLIVSHVENLARMRLGKVREQGEQRDGGIFQSFIAEMEKLCSELFEVVALKRKAKRERLEAEVKANFRLLQIADLLSLELCCGVSGSFVVDQVPAQVTGPYLSLNFQPVGEYTLKVSPYPFARPDVVVKVPGRIVRQRTFASGEALREHLQKADTTTITFHLKPA